MLIIIFLFILFTIIVFFNYQFKIITHKKKIRVVMYHSISTNQFEDQITITKKKFIEQLNYYKEKGYNTINFTDIENGTIPPKALLITFDDGFLDNYQEAFPLLKEYGFKAVCFLVLGKLGKNMDWAGKYVVKERKLMTIQQIKSCGPHIQFAYHTYKHDNYEQLSLEEIKKDLELCTSVVQENNLSLFPALSYTYGGYYRKKGKEQKAFFSLLKKYGINYAFRVGNRIALFPFRNSMTINRMDIRGYENMSVFKKRIKWGRIKLM